MDKQILSVLEKSPLFENISGNEISSITVCLSASTKQYQKNEQILHEGDSVEKIGIVLSGAVNIIKSDYWGNKNIVENVIPPGIFALSYACAKNFPPEITAEAAQNTNILFINAKKLLTTCSSACSFHSKLIANLVQLLASKNIMLNQKISILSQRTTREKIMDYLSHQALKQKSEKFTIPFDRKQLADYLSVDRSALSSELSKMRNEHIIEFTKNHFTMIQHTTF